jgi:hypothetical protein
MKSISRLFVFLLSIPVIARGATFTVSNMGDSGAGSLRQALTDANASAGADAIVFSGGAGTILLQSPLPLIRGEVSIQGPGAGVLQVNGNGLHRVFFVDSGSVEISGMRIQEGAANGGAGASNDASNRRGGGGGGLGAGGALFVNAGAFVRVTGFSQIVPDQREIAGALDALLGAGIPAGTLALAANEIARQDAAGVRRSLQALGNEEEATVSSAIMETSNHVTRQVARRLRARRRGTRVAAAPSKLALVAPVLGMPVPPEAAPTRAGRAGAITWTPCCTRRGTTTTACARSRSAR